MPFVQACERARIKLGTAGPEELASWCLSPSRRLVDDVRLVPVEPFVV